MSSFPAALTIGKAGSIQKMETSEYDGDPRGCLWMWKPPQKHRKYVLGCLPDGELVRTNSGNKPIEQVLPEDKLLDASGNYVGIRSLLRRHHSGDLVEVRVIGSSRPVCFTTEHPILCSDYVVGMRTHGTHKSIKQEKEFHDGFKWKDAGDLKANDWVRFPLFKAKPLSGKEILNQWTSVEMRHDFRVDPLCLIDADFWWLVGLWLADGYCQFQNHGGTIHFCLNRITDVHNVDRVVSSVRNIFGKSVSIRHRKGLTEVQFSSLEVATFLKLNFGSSARNKHIPLWVKHLPVDFCSSLVEGYWEGDGCLEGKRILNFVSVSEELLCDIQDLLLRLGVFGAIRNMRDEGVTKFPNRAESITQKTWELNISGEKGYELLRKWGAPTSDFKRPRKKVTRRYSFIEDGYLYVRILKVKRKAFEGYVNNFETETHSYCAGLITTHNCDPTVGRTGWNRYERSKEDAKTDNGAIEVIMLGRRNIGIDEPDEQVAEYAAPVDPFELGYIANIIGRLYAGVEEDQCGVIAEVHPGPGTSTFRQMIELGYTNHFRWERYADTAVSPTKQLGWIATPTTNRDLWVKASRHLNLRNAIIRSPWLAEEYADCRMNPDKQYAENPGGHDDRVRAFNLALWMANGWSLSIERTEEEVTETTNEPLSWQASDCTMEELEDGWARVMDRISGDY